MTIDYEEQQKRHPTAETQGLTILTPPPTPEKVTPRPSLSGSRLSDALSKFEQAVAKPSPQIDSSLINLLHETIRPQSQASRTSSLPTRTPFSRYTNPNTMPKQTLIHNEVISILPSGFHRLIQASNLLDDIDTTASSASSQDDSWDYASRARIKCLKRELKECVVRGVIESKEAGKEILVRALSAVVRLAELH